MPLGRCVRQIRCRHDFVRKRSDRISQLNGLKFIWDLNEYTFRKTYTALRYYAKIEVKKTRSDGCNGVIKPLKVPSKFVVPHGE